MLTSINLTKDSVKVLKAVLHLMSYCNARSFYGLQFLGISRLYGNQQMAVSVIHRFLSVQIGKLHRQTDTEPFCFIRVIFKRIARFKKTKK